MPDMSNYQYLINPHFNCEHDIAKKVYADQMSRTDGRDEIVKLTGMNAASASDYVSDFIYMMEGKQYENSTNPKCNLKNPV